MKYGVTLKDDQLVVINALCQKQDSYCVLLTGKIKLQYSEITHAADDRYLIYFSDRYEFVLMSKTSFSR